MKGTRLSRRDHGEAPLIYLLGNGTLHWENIRLETDLTRKKSADQGVSLYLAGYLTILGYAKFHVINFRLGGLS